MVFLGEPNSGKTHSMLDADISFLDQSSFRSGFPCICSHVLQNAQERPGRIDDQAKDSRNRPSRRILFNMFYRLSAPGLTMGRDDLPLERLEGLGLSPWIWSHDHNLHSSTIPSWRPCNYSSQNIQPTYCALLVPVLMLPFYGTLHVSSPCKEPFQFSF